MTIPLLVVASTLIAEWTILKGSLGTTLLQSVDRRTRWVVGVTIFLILGSAATLRFVGTDQLLWGSDEMVTLLAGIRLHLLPLWNLGARVRENFFKSLVMPIHGLGDPVFFYLVVALFRVFDIPATEGNLFRAGALLSMGSLVLLFVLFRRLFGPGAAVAALAFGAWNSQLIGCAKNGFQINLIIFLQLASLIGYLLHLTKRRWWSAFLMASLMVLCAGSELFYMAPVFLLLHRAYGLFSKSTSSALARQEQREQRRLWDSKDVLVWAAYGATMLLNGYLLLKMAPLGDDLTLFGHFYHNAVVLPHPPQKVASFLAHLNPLSLPPLVHHILMIAGLVAFWIRRSAYTLFGLLYLALVVGLSWFMNFTHGANLIHLLIPCLIILAVGSADVMDRLLRRLVRDRRIHLWIPGLIILAVETTDAMDRLLRRLVRDRRGRDLWAGVLCASLLVLVIAPWHARPAGDIPAPYRCVKAIGAAVRELGGANMPNVRVFIASNHTMVPTTMEYYLGLSATVGDHEPTHVFYIREMTPAYRPSQIARRMGFNGFDFYVEFAKEEFPGKEDVIKDMASSGLHEVYQVYDQSGVCARIYSPHASELKQMSIEQGNATFDRIYAHWNHLFYNVNVGTFWYFGAHY